MPAKNIGSGLHEDLYKDGSVKARGKIVAGAMDGYWEWFRRDGSKMRSGHFNRGEVVGEWITYDRDSAVYKVTQKTAGTKK